MNFARKCWSDLRWAWLASALITAPMILMDAFDLMKPSHIHSPLRGSATADYLLLSIHIITALIFSMAIVSHNFTPNLKKHLFSQPRSRGYFVWTAWLMGLLGLLTMWTLAMAVVEIIAIFGHDGFPPSLLFRYGGIVYSIIRGVAYYCISFALGAALGNSWQGAGLALLLNVSYDWWAMLRDRISGDRPWPVIGLPYHGWSEPLCFAAWIALALLLVKGAQKVLEWREA